MRILTPIHSHDPGGVERVAIRLSEAWAEAGIDSVVALGRRARVSRPGGGVRYRTAPSPRLSTAPVETIWMIWWLWRAVRAERPDVLYCAGNTYAVVVVAVRLLLGGRCPPIVAKISNDLRRADMPGPIRALYHRWCRLQGWLIDRFIVPAEALRDDVTRFMRVDSDRVCVVPNPVLTRADIEALRRTEPAEARPAGRRFVAAGRLVAQKNVGLLLDGFAAGGDPEDRLVILGEGPERAALQQRIRRLGLAGRATLAGHQDDLAPWLRDSDILLLSSDYEGVPGIVIEALAAGLGVVATDCTPAMGDLLGHGRFGALVRVRDHGGFALAVAMAARATDAGERARHAARFSVEAASARTADLFGQLVAGCKNSDQSGAVGTESRRRGGD